MHRATLRAVALGAAVHCGPGEARTDPPPPGDDPVVTEPSDDPSATLPPTDESTATADTGPAAPTCSGMPGLPGTTDHELDVAGVGRTFRVHLPVDLDPDEPVPVVLAFHGYTMSGVVMQDVTGWDAVADREHFAVVYPDGDQGLLGGPWNVGAGVCGAGAFGTSDGADFEFVVALLDALATVQCIDRDRVFATGFSMGGYFTHHLACEGPVPLRGAAPHSAGTYDGPCANGPVPVMILHGDADPLIVPACGEQAAANWLERNACPTATPAPAAVEGGACLTVEGCAGGTSVAHCSFVGMDHGWAGSTDRLYGGGAQYEDGVELIWGFFSGL
jgi:polyhydroxybutyrate depolymerase